VKQQELEDFVDTLARAEQEAARKISESEAQSQLRLEQLKRELEEENRRRLAEIELSWERKSQERLEGTEKQIAEMRQQTDITIKLITKRHQTISDDLVKWVIKRVTEP